MNTQVRMRLTHEQLAWAILHTYDGRSLHEVDNAGNLTFRNGDLIHDPVTKREVREEVLSWLARKGMDALGTGRRRLPEIYLWAAEVIYRHPDRQNCAAMIRAGRCDWWSTTRHDP